MTDLRPRFENLFEPYEIFPAGGTDRILLHPDRAEARGPEVVPGPDGTIETQVEYEGWLPTIPSLGLRWEF